MWLSQSYTILTFALSSCLFGKRTNRKGRELVFEIKKSESVSKITPLEEMLLTKLYIRTNTIDFFGVI
jgi:hypothetical protein